MSNAIRLPGNNTITLCSSALMLVIERALNDGVYSREQDPYRVVGITARTDNGAPVFDVQVTTDAKGEPHV